MHLNFLLSPLPMRRFWSRCSLCIVAITAREVLGERGWLTSHHLYLTRLLSPQCIAFKRPANHPHHLHISLSNSSLHPSLHTDTHFQAARAARVSARVVPSVTERFFVTTSRVLPSPLSDVSLVVVVSSVFLLVSLLAVATRCALSIYGPSR